MMIRQLIPQTAEADFKLLFPAYLEMANSAEALKFLSYTGLPFTDAQVSGWFTSHLDGGVDYFAAFAEGDRVEGIATIKANPITGFELLGLIVQKASRGKGIGRDLVRHILDVARQRGYKAVDVSVFADNPAMLRLVIGQGFIPVNITHHARFDGADVVALKCLL